MTARPTKHEDGSGRKRSARTDRAMTPAELVAFVNECMSDGGYGVLLSPGIHVEWYSPVTPEESEREAEFLRKQLERQRKWERDTYERLRVKFERMTVNDERYPDGCCWICGDSANHDDVPHGVATGDGRTRYDVLREAGEVVR